MSDEGQTEHTEPHQGKELLNRCADGGAFCGTALDLRAELARVRAERDEAIKERNDFDVAYADVVARIEENQLAEIVAWCRKQYWWPATPAGVGAAIEREFGKNNVND